MTNPYQTQQGLQQTAAAPQAQPGYNPATDPNNPLLNQQPPAQAPVQPQAPAAAPGAQTPPPANNGMATPSGAIGNPADMFATGTTTGSGHKLTDDEGACVLVKAQKVRQMIVTQYGESEAVQASWVVLDGPNAGAVRNDSLIFQRFIVNSLTSNFDSGRPFTVGVIFRDQARAKKGQSAPVVLADPTDEQLQAAMAAAKQQGWL
jgi:hypothetical protein|nr:MAG TPA: Huntingtin protein-like protein [Caudoviricetes sp.]